MCWFWLAFVLSFILIKVQKQPRAEDERTYVGPPFFKFLVVFLVLYNFLESKSEL